MFLFIFVDNFISQNSFVSSSYPHVMMQFQDPDGWLAHIKQRWSPGSLCKVDM